ncbi:MAG TPA: hypothetical protein VMV86_05070 [Methanosarcinales archaeon]|nr:hypothetical protein [Methanosarcinales archaeon]
MDDKIIELLEKILEEIKTSNDNLLAHTNIFQEQSNTLQIWMHKDDASHTQEHELLKEINRGARSLPPHKFK